MGQVEEEKSLNLRYSVNILYIIKVLYQCTSQEGTFQSPGPHFPLGIRKCITVHV